MNATVERPPPWIVVLNRGWGANGLLSAARRRAAVGEAAIMLVYVVSERRRPRRAWLWLARLTLNRAVGRGGPALATCLTLSRSVTAGVGLVAAGTGGAVIVRFGDTRRGVELRNKRIPWFPVDPDEFGPPLGPGPDAP